MYKFKKEHTLEIVKQNFSNLLKIKRQSRGKTKSCYHTKSTEE